jgi:altronate dehydratase large subunit
MDVNAGRIITGEASIEEVGEEAFARMIEVLNGSMTHNEAISYFGSMDIFCLGPVI